MTRIKIKDLPKDLKVGKEELKKIKGGLTSTDALTTTEPSFSMSIYKNVMDSTVISDLSDIKISDKFAPPYVPG